MKFPLQPIQRPYYDENGTIRFRENAIVQKLLKIAETQGYDMNAISIDSFPREDRVQFLQLLGMSFSGFCDFPCVNEDDVAFAKRMIEINLTDRKP